MRINKKYDEDIFTFALIIGTIVLLIYLCLYLPIRHQEKKNLKDWETRYEQEQAEELSWYEREWEYGIPNFIINQQTNDE